MISAIILKNTGDISSVQLKSNRKIYTTLLDNHGTGKLDIQYEWSIENYKLSLYAWTDGKAGLENKHEMPPPIDNNIYFGDMFFCKRINNVLVSFTEDEYAEFYLAEFGGFDDLSKSDESDESDDSDENEEDEEDEEYVPDEDNDESDEDNEEEDDESDEDNEEEDDESDEDNEEEEEDDSDDSDDNDNDNDNNNDN